MVKTLAGNVVTTQGPKGVGEVNSSSLLFDVICNVLSVIFACVCVFQDAFMRRPLPKIRHSVNTGFDEDRSVPPGTLNLGHIRQVFLSYQGLIEGEKPMNVEALAKKYNVDAVLLEKVVRFHTLPDKIIEGKSVKEASQAAAKLE